MYVHTTYCSYSHIFLHTLAYLWLSMLNVILLVRAACLWFCKADIFQFCWSAKFSRESGWTKDPRSKVLVPKQHAVGGKLHTCKHLYMLFLKLPLEVKLRNRYYIIRWYALPCRANRRMPLDVSHPSPVFSRKTKAVTKYWSSTETFSKKGASASTEGEIRVLNQKHMRAKGMNAKECVCMYIT